jgi:hypothetical protein
VIWPANSKDSKPIVLPDLVSKSEVLQKLKEAGASRAVVATTEPARAERPLER